MVAECQQLKIYWTNAALNSQKNTVQKQLIIIGLTANKIQILCGGIVRRTLTNSKP
jgi:hypothetical protein